MKREITITEVIVLPYEELAKKLGLVGKIKDVEVGGDSNSGKYDTVRIITKRDGAWLETGS